MKARYKFPQSQPLIKIVILAFRQSDSDSTNQNVVSLLLVHGLVIFQNPAHDRNLEDHPECAYIWDKIPGVAVFFRYLSKAFPNLRKRGGGAHWFLIVRQFVRSRIVQAIVFKIQTWIPHGKIAGPYIFLVRVIFEVLCHFENIRTKFCMQKDSE